LFCCPSKAEEFPEEEKMKRFLSNLSDDLILQILLYLQAVELLQSEAVCATWRRVSRSYDSEVWKLFTEPEWRKVQINIPKEHKILTKNQMRSVNVLKKALVGIDLHRCVEKKDYQSMLLAKFLFLPIMERELAGDDLRFKGKYLSMYYPEWALTISPFKASYLYARKEINRKQITKTELCKIPWVFRFKKNTPMTNQGGGIHEENAWEIEFREDYTSFSTLHGQMYHWKWVDLPEGVVGIQVDQYPVITSFRYGDGAWGLENMYVYMKQSESIDVDEVPLVPTY
jgi:hypothetical protein